MLHSFGVALLESPIKFNQAFNTYLHCLLKKTVVYFTTVFGVCYKDILVFKEFIINPWLLLFCFRVSTAVLGTVMAETG